MTTSDERYAAQAHGQERCKSRFTVVANAVHAKDVLTCVKPADHVFPSKRLRTRTHAAPGRGFWQGQTIKWTTEQENKPL